MKNTYFKKIKSLLPENFIKNYEFISEGYDNDVIIVNNELVFRFTKKGVNFKDEIDFLLELSKYSNLSTPKPIYYDNEYSFTGYKLINGIQLKPKIFNNIDNGILDNLSNSIAQFLFILHNFKYKNLDKLPKYNKINVYLEKIENNIKSNNTPKLDIYYKQILDDIKSFDFENIGNTIVHNDLYSRNIFINNDLTKISGIIDFSDIAISDPTIDFVFLYFENPSFTKNILKSYNNLRGLIIEESKVELCARIFALNEYFRPDSHNKKIADKWIGIN